MNLRKRLHAMATLMALLTAVSATAPVSAAPLAPRVIGGDDTLPGELPFVVALVHSASVDPFYANDYQAQFCGGTVIAPRWVLTAAHCVEYSRPGQFEVITGVNVLPQAPPFATRTAVAAVLMHPQYDEDKIANDLALLYLATPVTTSALFSVDDGSTVAGLVLGDDMLVAGWGLVDQGNLSTYEDDLTNPVMQKAVLDFVPFAACNSQYYEGTLHASATCAGFLSGPPRDSCFGDSGGPLMRATGGGHWRQTGIVSYGSIFCAQANSPAVYVNVGYYRDFITGAQSLPDLQVLIATVPGSEQGNQSRARITLNNNSPLTAAPGTSFTLTFNGDLAVTNLATLPGCTGSTTGTTTSTVTTVTCNPGTIAALASAQSEFALALYGDGPWSVDASATTSSGDYFAPNNSARRTFSIGGTAPTGSSSSAGATLAMLPLLLLVLLRRRHAPHHSLRLRQLLRLG